MLACFSQAKAQTTPVDTAYEKKYQRKILIQKIQNAQNSLKKLKPYTQQFEFTRKTIEDSKNLLKQLNDPKK
jgi:hypothetical protein